MTRLGVLKAIKGKVLLATRVGGSWVLRQPVVEGARTRRGAQPPRARPGMTPVGSGGITTI